MAYRSYRARNHRNIKKKTKNNLIATIVICAVLLFLTVNYLIPNLVNGVAFINHLVKPSKKISTTEDISIAPPVLNIPYIATNSAQINIKGYANPNTKVRIYLDDAEVSEITSKDDGSFLSEDISLNLGTNNIYGRSVDEKESQSLPSKTFRLIYDNEKPDLEVSEPSDGKEIKGDKKVTISGKTEPGSQLFINNSQVIIKSDGSFSSDFPINEGDNSLNFKSYDSAGNINEITRHVIQKP